MSNSLIGKICTMNIFTDCTVTFNQLAQKDEQPIYFSELRNEFWQPTLTAKGMGVFEIRNGEIITVYCKGELKKYDSEQLRVQCDGNELKTYSEDSDEMGDDAFVEQPVDFSKLKCKSVQVPAVRRTDRKCGYRGVVYQVYYEAACRELVVYESCHWAKHLANHWTHHTMTPVNSAYQAGYRDGHFRTGGIFAGFRDKEVQEIYQKVAVREEFECIWGGKVVQLLPESGSQYIARGHLMANMDGALHTYQRATFMYVNVMPQFQSNNQGNWLTVEKAVRRFAGLYGQHLDIYTGTADIMIYKGVMLYIYTLETTRYFPIMNIFYKIIISKATREAMVVVGVNNVLAEEEGVQKFIFCDDVRDDTGLYTKSLNENARQNVFKGYIYTCKIRDFLYRMKMMDWVEYSEFLEYGLMRLPGYVPNDHSDVMS